MRYYWGMGVGHVYSHGEQEQDGVEDMDFEDEELAAEDEPLEEDSDDADPDPWQDDSDQEASDEEDNARTWSEDEEFLELENMYN